MDHHQHAQWNFRTPSETSVESNYEIFYPYVPMLSPSFQNDADLPNTLFTASPFEKFCPQRWLNKGILENINTCVYLRIYK